MDNNKHVALKALKIILWIYIILCLVIAGLNYGYASYASPAVSAFITKLWHFYENWIKTLFIIIGSFLTLKIVGATKRTTMRKRNLTGFIVAALTVHIVAPLLTGNGELYFFAMPLPWTSTPLQLLYTESSFYMSRFPIWGMAGISVALIFYILITVVVLVGTLLFGRRWQCATLCLFNGFASEVFAPAIPLVGRKKQMNAGILRMFSALRWVFLSIALFFTIWWMLLLLGMHNSSAFKLISKLESYKYLSAELLITMFFWVAFIGRGYCYYCPLGTALAFLSKLSGQHIKTDNTSCIQCSQCNSSCSMSIDIKSHAEKGKAVTDLRCVGCGHCVDSCATKNLSYLTNFTKNRERQVREKNHTGSIQGRS